MNKIYAAKIVDVVTMDQIETMMENAKNNIDEWEGRSVMNHSLSRGIAYNIFAKYLLTLRESGINRGSVGGRLGLKNMLREFGEYLPDGLGTPPKRKKNPEVPVSHNEPDFSILANTK